TGSWNNINDAANIYSGATTQILTLLRPTVAMSGNKYRCIITGICAPSAITNEVTLTVNARLITITADPQTKTYGDTDPALTYQINDGNLVNGDAITESLTRDAGEDVSSYNITQ